MGRATHDQNFVPTLIGVDSTTFLSPTEAAVNATTHALITESSTSAVPVTANNPAFPTFTRNGSGYVTTIEMLIGGVTYTKTITRDGSNYITAISAWA